MLYRAGHMIRADVMDEPAGASAEAVSGRSDLRCANSNCELFELKLEADEVSPTPGAQPDRCASCGQPLEAFSKGEQ